LALGPVRDEALLQLGRGVHGEAGARLHVAAVVAGVVDARFRILGDVMAGGDVRRVVPTGRRDRYRKRVEALAVERIAGDDYLVDRAGLDEHRRNRIRARRAPLLVDVIDLATEPTPVDPPTRRQPHAA